MTVVDIEHYDPDARRLAELLDQLQQTTQDLGLLLADAAAAQWQAPPMQRPREDTTERAKGVRSDPTARVALDERRLAVRVQVQHAEALLYKVNRALSATRHHLGDALAAWEGPRE